jgi:coenzyme F420 hydrogenase subunit beta
LAIRKTCGQEIFKHMNAKGLRELQEEVLETGLCAYCGACAGACPYLVSYKGRIVILDNCTIPEPQCYEYCPRTDTDIEAVSQHIFSEAYSYNELGTVKRVLMARSTDQHIRERAQYGGTVTTLLSFALAEGLIDSAILTKMSPDKLPIAFLARSKKEILQGAGSNFIACPVLEALNQIPEDSTDTLGIVATPCQILALSKMKKNPPQNRADIANVNLVIGLFCTWALCLDTFHGFLKENCDLSQVIKFDIPPPPANRFDIYTKSGNISFPLEQIREFIMTTCNYCLDMTAEFADISVGSVEGIEGWNTVLVRTDAGIELIDLAIARGIVETRDLPDQNLAHLKTAALNKKKTALKNIVEKTGNKEDLIYVSGVSEDITDRLLDN